MKISKLRILSHRKIASSATIKWYSGPGVASLRKNFAKWSEARRQKVQETNMFRYFVGIALCLVASVASGAIFLFSLLHQFALVEVAASLVTALQVFFLSSAIADLLEKSKRPSQRRNSLVLLFTVFLVAFYSFTRYFR